MKIQLFERIKDLLTKQPVLIKKDIKEEDIISSFLYHSEEAFTDVIYYFIELKSGEKGLYIYPKMKFLGGDNIVTKSQVEILPKREHHTSQSLSNVERTNTFYRLKGEISQAKDFSDHYNPDRSAFQYLNALYYHEDDRYKKEYEDLFKKLKKECDKLGITYDTNPEKILETKINLVKPEYVNIDISMCSSKDKVDSYFQEKLSKCKNSRDLSYELSDFQFTKQHFINSYCGNFLCNSNNLIDALQDKNYPNRKSILKNYLEFFYSKDLAFEIVRYLDYIISNADQIQMDRQIKEYNENTRFIEDLEKITTHNNEEVAYLYHATTSESSAKQILDEGFYAYSSDLSSTTFPELSINQILTYSYGNLFEKFGDYMVVLAKPKGTDIIRELSPEEQDKVRIMPRRNAIVGNKPEFIVDKKYIVGIIDKEHQKIIFNKEYQKDGEKQI